MTKVSVLCTAEALEATLAFGDSSSHKVMAEAAKEGRLFALSETKIEFSEAFDQDADFVRNNITTASTTANDIKRSGMIQTKLSNKFSFDSYESAQKVDLLASAKRLGLAILICTDSETPPTFEQLCEAIGCDCVDCAAFV